VAALSCAFAPAALGGGRVPARAPGKVKLVHIHYRAHNGVRRSAWVILPAWYGPHDDPPLPLVISPHGRGVGALANARLWGALPARGGFAVVSPAGEGRRLPLYSWGSAGQIDDLARMPTIVHLTLPWVHVNHRRIYAFGGSMGGQETLLLLARHPKLLAGAAAFDAVTDLSQQYNSFRRLGCDKACQKQWGGQLGRALQALARVEVGGSPWKRPQAYAERSPITYSRALAASCVPLELWWSVNDQVVLDEREQTGALYRRIMSLNRYAPVEEFVGYWRHSAEMQSHARLPAALADLGLIPPVKPLANVGVHVEAPVSLAPGCRRTPPAARPAPSRPVSTKTRSANGPSDR